MRVNFDILRMDLSSYMLLLDITNQEAANRRFSAQNALLFAQLLSHFMLLFNTTYKETRVQRARSVRERMSVYLFLATFDAHASLYRVHKHDSLRR